MIEIYLYISDDKDIYERFNQVFYYKADLII